LPVPKCFLERVKLCSAIHLLNSYRAINLLLETDHWEEACTNTRGIFELMLNLEEITKEPSMAEQQAKRFCDFGALQELLNARALAQYHIDTGRLVKANETKLQDLDKIAKGGFKQFLFTDKKRRMRWRDNWCNKSVRDLAYGSSNSMHAAQYQIIYSLFSCYTHSAPMAVLRTHIDGRPGQSREEVEREHAAREDENLLLVTSMATQFLLETLIHIGDSIPRYDAWWTLSILNELYGLYGVKPPMSDSELLELRSRYRN
jgi:hypothetical protein